MDVTGVTWRTSSYTGSGGGNCIEVSRHTEDRHILVRDTKNRRGPVLAFSPEVWLRFMAEVRDRRP